MNPYDFVRLPEKVTRERAQTYQKLNGKSGRIRCCLTAITPIFIPSTQITTGTQVFITTRREGRDVPVIPGSSLKGVIRCVAEAVSESCLGLSGELLERGKVNATYQNSLAPTFTTCDQMTRLCPACRLFGMVSNKSHFLGQVSLSDALALRAERGKPITLKPLMNPRPHHNAFYRPDGDVAGRKFYFHHALPPKTTIQPNDYTKNVVPLLGLTEQGEPQTVFQFEVSFTNLDERQYQLLLFSLVLTEQMRHKIGGGKPLGLGTVKIEITELQLYPAAQRYKGLGTSSATTLLTEQALRQHVQTTVGAFTATPTMSLKDLQHIWQYPPPHEDYRYPDQDWFNKHSQATLDDTP